jgi:DNA-directed RNA polymerase specialized sigma24 family protein
LAAGVLVRAFNRGHLIAQALGVETPSEPPAVPPPLPPDLTAEDKAMIRERYGRGWSKRALARLYRVKVGTVAMIVRSGKRDADGLTAQERHDITTLAADGEELPDIAHALRVPFTVVKRVVQKTLPYWRRLLKDGLDE